MVKVVAMSKSGPMTAKSIIARTLATVQLWDDFNNKKLDLEKLKTILRHSIPKLKFACLKLLRSDNKDDSLEKVVSGIIRYISIIKKALDLPDSTDESDIENLKLEVNEALGDYRQILADYEDLCFGLLIILADVLAAKINKKIEKKIAEECVVYLADLIREKVDQSDLEQDLKFIIIGLCRLIKSDSGSISPTILAKLVKFSDN